MLLARKLLAETFAVSWDLSTASYDSVSFSVLGQESEPTGITFKTDGSKMYIAGKGSNSVYQYTLSTAWDLGTASYDSVSFNDIGNIDSSPDGLVFKPDGTKMYVIGRAKNNDIYQYSLFTAWDLSTVDSDYDYDFSIPEDDIPTGLAFKTDGTKMYMVGDDTDSVYQYTLSTAWDLGTASYDSVSFSAGSEDGTPTGITFKTDGSKMYIVGGVNDSVYQYTLSTAWDLSTASYDSVSFSAGSEDGTPTGITFKTDGTKMYIMGHNNSTVFQYSFI